MRDIAFLQEQPDTRLSTEDVVSADAIRISDSSVTIEACRVTSAAASGIGVYGSKSCEGNEGGEVDPHLLDTSNVFPNIGQPE